jgi:hypothetical protein
MARRRRAAAAPCLLSLLVRCRRCCHHAVLLRADRPAPQQNALWFNRAYLLVEAAPTCHAWFRTYKLAAKPANLTLTRQRVCALQAAAAVVAASAYMCHYNARPASQRDMRAYCFYTSKAVVGSKWGARAPGGVKNWFARLEG